MTLGPGPLDSVYLDHAASTPMRAVAAEALADREGIGAANASGAHRAARRARAAVDDAREALAAVLAVDPGDIVVTSGGTEADNLAVLGHHAAVGGGVICSAIEHPAVLEAVEQVGGKTVGVDARGIIDLDRLDGMLDADVRLVSVMTVNNEVGAVQPIEAVAEIVRRRSPGAVLHTDAVQALPWVDLRTVTPHVDLLSLSAHKFGGPQGVGLCVVRSGCDVAARQVGGGQERERRSGTLNVAGIAAMAAAAVEADADRSSERVRLAGLRDRLVGAVTAGVGSVTRTGVPGGDDAHLAPGFAHFCFDGIESEALLFLLDERDVYASAGSACASGAQHPSHVLAAMGIDAAAASGSLRLSLGHTTTADDVDRAAVAVVESVERLRRFPR